MPKPKPRQVSAHQLVVKTAKDMAASLYEELAKDNTWYRMNPNQAVFVEMSHGSLIEQARGILAKMLEGDYPEQMKLEIADALILDKQLVLGRGVRNVVMH